jgi:hypothetical protein
MPRQRKGQPSRKQKRALRRLEIKMGGYLSGQNNKNLTKFNKPGAMNYH